MRSPSIVPGFNADVYVVLDDFGAIGRCYRETDEFAADKESVIRNLISGQYNDPVRVVAFNTSEGWSRDVSEEIAHEVSDWARRDGDELSPGLRDWVEYQIALGARSKSAVGGT